MQRITTTLFTLCCLICLGSVAAQTRYIDPIFEVGEPTSGVYGVNVDVFLMGANQLEYDVYQPVDDTSTELRPCVVVFPTGNFLLQYLNQGPYGSRKDSAVVEIISEVVSRGYVGFSAEYRTGWLPTSPDQDIRTSTLLQAAYRGGQDAHTMARYLRKSVVEDGNPYQIDTTRIVFWGLGTGGYVTMTHAFLDSVDEVLADLRFYDDTDPDNPVPYVNIAINADPQGTLPAFFDPATMTVPSNIPNHVGYGSTVAMSINTGGALGDIDWMEGDASPHQEPIVLGYHSLTDPFAPFTDGTVIVPTTGDVVIEGVAGTESILRKAQQLGLNDAIIPANALSLPAEFSALSNSINQTNAFFNTQTTTNPLNMLDTTRFALSHNDMFPFLYPRVVGSPFNWLDPVRVTAEIAAFNAATGQMINATTVIGGESLSNPFYLDPAGARTVIDTMIAHFIPRAYIGMNLEALINSTEDVVAGNQIGLTIAPNPAAEFITVTTEEAFAIREAVLYDLNGRAVSAYQNIDTNTFRINRGNLPRGQYVLKIRVDQGVTSKIVLFN